MSALRPLLRRRNGYTLLELLLVIAILALTITLVMPELFSLLIEMKMNRAILDLKRIQNEVDVFEQHVGSYPPDLDALGGAVPKADPWGRPYLYWRMTDVKGKGNHRWSKDLRPLNPDYDLFSRGPDGDYKPKIDHRDSLDDVIRADGGRYLGRSVDFQ